MDSSNDILPFIGLMRKAGALELGADAVAESCALGRARIVLMANDASGNTSKWMKTAAEQKEIPLIVLPTGKNELGGAVGVARRGNEAQAGASEAPQGQKAGGQG